MRIALFSGNYNYLKEGANQALNILVGYLEENADCEVRVYSPVTDTPAFEPAGTLVPVRSIALPVRGEFRLALGLPADIRKDLERFGPDIVHVSTPDILGTRAQTAAINMGVPVVASMHTRFETYLEYYHLSWLRPLAQAHIDRFYRRSDHVVAPTPALVDELRTMRGDDHVSVWSRGIDREQFAPTHRDEDWRRRNGFADSDIVVLFFGRLVLEKGIDIYLSVMSQLKQSGISVRALVVGAGPASIEFDALTGNVATGHLEGAELARAIASADIMLHPSITETFGNVILEAMASGLPVVSADAPNSRSLLVSGETGILCSPHDMVAYTNAITQLANDTPMRRKMSAAARKASKSYSWDAASESVARVYHSLYLG